MKFIIAIVVLVMILASLGLRKYLMNIELLKESANFRVKEALEVASKGKGTVSGVIIRNGVKKYFFYEDGKKGIASPKYFYEIGSINKTLTAALFLKVMADKGMDYKSYVIPETKLLARDLLTHKAGLPKYHNVLGMSLKGLFDNPFRGISKEELFEYVEDNTFNRGSFVYSNLGFSILGHGLADLQNTSYEDLMVKFLKEELQMDQTYFANGSGNFPKYWVFDQNDGYGPAGALVSNIHDMGNYLEQLLSGKKSYLNQSQEILSDLSGEGRIYQDLGSSMDAIAAAWIYDAKNKYYWHNGATAHFNSYMAFDAAEGIGVVVLSSSGYMKSLPATVIGIKIMEELRGSLSEF